MSKNFSQKVFFLIAVNLLIKPLWIFGVERVIQIKTGFDAYGLYFTLFNFTYLFSLLSDMGINNYNIKLLAHKHTQSIKSTNLLEIKLLLSIIYLISVLSIAFVLGYIQTSFLLLITLIFYQFGFSFLGFLRSYLTGLQLYKTDILFSVLDKILLLIFFIPLLNLSYFNTINLSIQYFASAQLVAIFISILIGIVIVKNKINFQLKGFKLSLLKETILQLLPFSLFMFLVLAYNKVDSIMLERMLDNGAAESGNYAAAYRLLDAFTMIPVLFASFFYPMLSKQLAEKKSISNWMNTSSELLISIAIIIAIPLSFFAKEWMKLLYPTHNSIYLTQIFSVLILSIIPISIYFIFSSALTAKGSLKILNLIAFGSLILNVLLNVFMIPNYHAFGAALATIISLGLAAIMYVYFYHQQFKAKPNIKLLFRLIVLSILMCLSTKLFEYFETYWLIKFGGFVIFGFLVSFILKLIQPKKIISLLKFTA
ncbi:MAG: oligosaccharide flippase family protein [Bacteroidetes bacterium]|nr:oligosaccharide flippase family protein [Bacteroidota bacterium]MBU1485696.1 oligosaccharide flippase family protein [Bacteroidota bacterium]MBU2268949.1 oligosaccharide flippase family protein [Bacteroidota bacterium]MBU2375750.1 oligosaccharide flippase family protein [Bacteroidota bacterium]